MTSVQRSGSVYNAIPSSAGIPNLASPAGSVHVPLSAGLGHASHPPPQAQRHTLTAPMRASPAQHMPATFPPRPSQSAATAPGVLLQHSPPSSRAGSMQHRRLVSAAAAAPYSGDNDDVRARRTSLAVSVANTANANARPTSTQEGAETPIAASDDDTIEMRGTVGRHRRLRSSGEVAMVVVDAAADAQAQPPPPVRQVASQVPAPEAVAQPHATAHEQPQPYEPGSQQQPQPQARAARRMVTRAAASAPRLSPDAALDASRPGAPASLPGHDPGRQHAGPIAADAACTPDAPLRSTEGNSAPPAALIQQADAHAQPVDSKLPSDNADVPAAPDLQMPAHTHGSNAAFVAIGTSTPPGSDVPPVGAVALGTTPGDPHFVAVPAHRSASAEKSETVSAAPVVGPDATMGADVGLLANCGSRDGRVSPLLADPGARGSAVLRAAAAALRRDQDAEIPAVVEVEPEPQPAACTVPLQPPPQLPTSCDSGGRGNRPAAGREPVAQASGGLVGAGGANEECDERGHVGGLNGPRGAAAGDGRRREEVVDCEEVQGEVQGGEGMELSVEQGRAVVVRAEEEVDGEVGGGGRADAIIGDGIVGAATDDLENKMSVEMEVNFGVETQVLEAVGGGGAAEGQVPGGGRADAVIMRAGGDDGEEEVQAKRKRAENGSGSSCEDRELTAAGVPARGAARQPQHATAEAQGQAAGGAALVAEGNIQAAAVSGTLGRMAGAAEDGWRAGGSPRVSESGSGNAGQRDAWDNESEAFQGSAGAVHEVGDRAHSSGLPGREHREGVGEVMGGQGRVREEGEGEVGAASREASRGQADSVRTPSGFLDDSPRFRGAAGVGRGGNAASRAPTGGNGPMPFSGDALIAATESGGDRAWVWAARDMGAGAVQQGEGEGEIAGPVFRDCVEPQAREPAEHHQQGAPSQAHLSRAGEVSLHERVVPGEAAQSGPQGRREPFGEQETVVESTHHPDEGLQPTGSRTGEALPHAMSAFAATRAASGGGANFGAVEDPERDPGVVLAGQPQRGPPYQVIAHQGSVNLTVHQPPASGGVLRSVVPSLGQPALQSRGLLPEAFERHPLSRVGSVDNVATPQRSADVAALGAAKSSSQLPAAGVGGDAPIGMAPAHQGEAQTNGVTGEQGHGLLPRAGSVHQASSGQLHMSQQVAGAQQDTAGHGVLFSAPPPRPQPHPATNAAVFPFLPPLANALHLQPAAPPAFLFPNATPATRDLAGSVMPMPPYAILSTLVPHRLSSTGPVPRAPVATNPAVTVSLGALLGQPPQVSQCPQVPRSLHNSQQPSAGPPTGVPCSNTLTGLHEVVDPVVLMHGSRASASGGVTSTSPRSQPGTNAMLDGGSGLAQLPPSTLGVNGLQGLAQHNGMNGADAASEVPLLLPQIPGHLHSWLQEICKKDPRGGQLLQLLRTAPSAFGNPTAPHFPPQATAGGPTGTPSFNMGALPNGTATAPFSFPASFLPPYDQPINGLTGALATPLLGPLPSLVQSSAEGRDGGAAQAHGQLAEQRSGTHGAVVTEGACDGGAPGMPPQPLATLLSALGVPNRQPAQAGLPGLFPGALAVAPPATTDLQQQAGSGPAGAVKQRASPLSSPAKHRAVTSSSPAGNTAAAAANGAAGSPKGRGAAAGTRRSSLKRSRAANGNAAGAGAAAGVAADSNGAATGAGCSGVDTGGWKRSRTSAGASGLPPRAVGPNTGTRGAPARGAAEATAHNLTALVAANVAPAAGAGNTDMVRTRARTSAPRFPGAGAASQPTRSAAGSVPVTTGSAQPRGQQVGAGVGGDVPAASSGAGGTGAAGGDSAITDAMAALLDLRTGADGASSEDGGDGAEKQGGKSGTALTPTQRAVLEKRLGAVFESLRMDPVALQHALHVALVSCDGAEGGQGTT